MRQLTTAIFFALLSAPAGADEPSLQRDVEALGARMAWAERQIEVDEREASHRFVPTRRSTGDLDLRILPGESVTVTVTAEDGEPGDCSDPPPCDDCPPGVPDRPSGATVVLHEDVEAGMYGVLLLGGGSEGQHIPVMLVEVTSPDPTDCPPDDDPGPEPPGDPRHELEVVLNPGEPGMGVAPEWRTMEKRIAARSLRGVTSLGPSHLLRCRRAGGSPIGSRSLSSVTEASPEEMLAALWPGGCERLRCLNVVGPPDPGHPQRCDCVEAGR